MKIRASFLSFLGLLFAGGVGLFLFFLTQGTSRETMVIKPQPTTPQAEANSEKEKPYSSPPNASAITDLPCERRDQRPFAIMYSGDPGAREYFANLSQADFVLEMPHRATHGQPRLMGLFQCQTPEIVGPMRSGRVDHISVANSFDAIYVPWGGSSIGKSLLKQGAVDHIDCNGEVYPGGFHPVCFRRDGPMSRLASASSSVPELIKQSEELGYLREWQGQGFSHQGDAQKKDRPNYAKVMVGFEAPNEVSYQYDSETNAYLRSFHGQVDRDYESGQQYAPKNLIVIRTEKSAWSTAINYSAQGLKDPWLGVDAQHRQNDSGQYPNMQLGDPWFDTKFEGEARFYFNGQEVIGTWKREKGSGNPFLFYDQEGEEIQFVSGQIWMHVLENYQTIAYQTTPPSAAISKEGNFPNQPENQKATTKEN